MLADAAPLAEARRWLRNEPYVSCDVRLATAGNGSGRVGRTDSPLRYALTAVVSGPSTGSVLALTLPGAVEVTMHNRGSLMVYDGGARDQACLMLATAAGLKMRGSDHPVAR